MTKNILLIACGAVVGFLVVLPAVPATPAALTDLDADQDGRMSAAERELFRQDLEHIQQNFYQASPEMRRRWIESMRERRQQLDQEEDQATLVQPRIRTTRAAPAEPPRPAMLRVPTRERALN